MDTEAKEVKPRVKFADFKAAKRLMDGSMLGEWTITMLGGGIHPAWVQVKRKKETQMIRRGDVRIHELARFCANQTSPFHREKA